MRFSEKLILLRKRKGMTQEEFSRAVGVSRQSVYKWESGQSYPEAAKLLEIRRLYGVSIDHLLDESVTLPSSLNENRVEIVEENKEKITTPPSIETPIIRTATVDKEPLTLAVEAPPVQTTEPKKPEPAVHQSPRPASTSVLVQKKRKPSTLKEIVGAFFGKKR